MHAVVSSTYHALAALFRVQQTRDATVEARELVPQLDGGLGQRQPAALHGVAVLTAQRPAHKQQLLEGSSTTVLHLSPYHNSGQLHNNPNNRSVNPQILIPRAHTSSHASMEWGRLRKEMPSAW